MSHLTDDELVLHFYDEDGPDIVRVERHLETCVVDGQAQDQLKAQQDILLQRGSGGPGASKEPSTAEIVRASCRERV